MLLALKLQRTQLGNAVHQKPDLFSEIPDQFLLGIFSVLYHIVQESRNDGLFVHAQFSQNLSHRHGMDQIRLSGFSQLTPVHLFCYVVGTLDQLDIVIRIIIK